MIKFQCESSIKQVGKRDEISYVVKINFPAVERIK
jgi:hypothetical protein